VASFLPVRWLLPWRACVSVVLCWCAGNGWLGRVNTNNHTQRLCFKLDVIHKHSKSTTSMPSRPQQACRSWWCGCLVLLPVSWSFIRTLCLFLPSASKLTTRSCCLNAWLLLLSTGTSTKVASTFASSSPAWLCRRTFKRSRGSRGDFFALLSCASAH